MGAKDQMKCAVCGAMLLSAVVVCEHAEPLVEAVLHGTMSDVAAKMSRPTVVLSGKEHPIEDDKAFVALRPTYEIAQATTSTGAVPASVWPQPTPRSWHPAYYVSGITEPVTTSSS